MSKTSESDEEIVSFPLRIPGARREELDRLLSKLKGKGALAQKVSRNDCIEALIVRFLDAPAAEQEALARRMTSRR